MIRRGVVRCVYVRLRCVLVVIVFDDKVRGCEMCVRET